MRHRCHEAPGRVAPIAASRPACASLVTSLTPARPRAVSDRRNVSQPAPSSAVVTSMPEDFAVALGVDPDRDQGVHVDDPSVLADLEHQGVGSHERVWASILATGTPLGLSGEILRRGGGGSSYPSAKLRKDNPFRRGLATSLRGVRLE